MQHAAIDFHSSQPVSAIKTSYLSTLDLNLVNASQEDTIEALLSSGRRRVAFMNAHCCNVMQNDHGYAMAVRTADMLLPDGFGVSLAAKLSGAPLTANLNGTDLIPALLAKAAAHGKSVFLFGGKPGTAELAAMTLLKQTPGLRIAGTRDGFDGAKNTDAVIADINQSGADIVLVALGVPAQDIWLHQNADHLNANLTFGVGALFDFLAGNVRRAPSFVRKARSEWMWRLAMEPKRMANRYLVGNATFLARTATKAISQIKGSSVARRTLDVTVAASALIALAPIFAFTALAIRFESKGPIFFHQSRVGKNGKTFKMIKFRSMVQNAEALRADLLKTSDRDGICFKSKSDPRITRVGRFIRRASIDELPQIWNVLRGEMSIVGPRPALPSEVSAYPQHAFGRLAVNPGITGIWQVSGRADIGFDDMVKMDLNYANTRTVLLDLLIIALTFRAVVSGRGAH